jgi:hypothetical protein
MDLIIGRVFSQREVNRISNCVWETLKCISVSLEAEDNDFDNDVLHS